VRAWLILAGAALAMGACGRPGTATVIVGNGVAPVPGSELTAAVGDLCAARQQADAHPAAAASTFYLRSHARLHLLASALEPVDRARSGALLEAMYAVERDIAAPRQPPALPGDLAALGRQAGSGLTALRLPRPSCTAGNMT